MKTLTPDFKYSMAGVDGYVNEGSSLWNLFLEGEKKDRSGFCLSHFFKAATAFIQQDNYRGLEKGFKFYTGKQLSCSDIIFIEISIEKHGAFYHPARVSVQLEGEGILCFVLNTAVSEPGLSVLDNEVAALERLAVDVPDVVLPRVFSAGRIALGEFEAAFFISQWFEGFLEFHIAGATGNRYLELWESDGRVLAVHGPNYFEIYEHASEILTRLYNLETFEQVFPWHHAAGDFVAKPSNGGFQLRLITVRNYDSMIGIAGDSGELDMEDINRAQLLFFINLSLRMRIDRIGGTNEFCMVDPGVVPHIVAGFFRGLGLKRFGAMAGDDLCRSFLDYTEAFDGEEFLDILGMTVGSYNPDAPEIPLIKRELAVHAELLMLELREIGKKSFFIDKAP